MTATVTADALVDLWLPRFGMTPAGCRLQYKPDDPYAVTLTLEHGSGRSTWTFARSLVAEGIVGHAGEGDVRVWRVNRSDGIVAFALCAQDRTVHLYAGLPAIADFVKAMHDAVPPGTEAGFADIDAELAALLEDRGD